MEAKNEMIKNMDKIKSMEREIEELTIDLNAPLNSGLPPPGIRGSLVDAEGFPRNDIDIYQIKLKRQQLSILQTDHINAMKKMEEMLVQLHSEARESGVADAEKNAFVRRSNLVKSEEKSTKLSEKSSNGSSSDYNSAIPFALVDKVNADSPASKSGLKIGDKIVAFGGIEFANNENLRALAEVVRSNVGQKINVVVKRVVDSGLVEDILILSLIPHVWAGPGLLGCHMVPILK